MNAAFLAMMVKQWKDCQMTMTKVEIEIPKAMTPYLTVSPGDSALRRNALLLYPMIWEGKMSHGRAAEIFQTGIR